MAKNEFFMTCLNEGVNIQFHSKEMQAKDGKWFYGYIEHDVVRNHWFILCYIEETNDFSHCCDDCPVIYGMGNTLKEAATEIKNDEWYNKYPLFEAFK